MKIYSTPKVPYQIRLQIIKVGLPTEHLSLEGTTLTEVESMVKTVIENQKISPLIMGKVTNVNIREYLPYPDSKNGEQLSVSLRGFEPKEVLALIINHLTKQENGN